MISNILILVVIIRPLRYIGKCDVWYLVANLTYEYEPQFNQGDIWG